MTNKVFGAIGILAGGGIVLHWWLARSATTVGAAASNAYEVGYQTGQSYVAVFGAVLFVTGLVTLFKKST